MSTRIQAVLHQRSSALWIVSLACGLVGLSALSACESDPVGHTTETTKKTVETPTEKVTTTETHTKDTKIVAPPR